MLVESLVISESEDFPTQTVGLGVRFAQVRARLKSKGEADFLPRWSVSQS